MNSLAAQLFADHWKWWFMRLLSPAQLRRWFLSRCGNDTQPFRFSRDLSATGKRLLILPEQLESLAAYLPLIRALTAQARRPEHLLMLSKAEFIPLLKALNLATWCQAYEPGSFRYGTQEFALLEKRVRESPWDLTLNLDLNPSLLKLYLIRKSAAAYRVGFRCEEFYPFLNISLSGQGSGNAGEFARILGQQFGIDRQQLRPYLPHADLPSTTQNVLLLSLEPSLEDGKIWTPQEIVQLHDAAHGLFRFLALDFGGQASATLFPTLEKLGIRVTPVGASYHTFLDQLKQYRALIALNSPHALLAAHISQIPVIIYSSNPLSFEWDTVRAIKRQSLLSETKDIRSWIPGENHPAPP